MLVNSGTPSDLKPALDCFRNQTGINELPDPSISGQQRVWDDQVSAACRDQLMSGVDQVHRARLLASCQPHTAAWLQAVPVPSLGLHLDPETVRIAVALRLGAPVCEPHSCRLCGRSVNRLGHHALSCQKSAGRFPRHAQLNDLVKRSLSAAGIPSVLEPVGLDRGDGRRPDGLTTFPFSSGKCLAWDATCTDTFADSVITASALEPGTAARAAEARKEKRYASLATQYLFAPLAVETSGVIGPAATRLIKELGRRTAAATGERRETAWLWQRVSMAIIRGNAAAIRGSAAQTAINPAATYDKRPAVTAQVSWGRLHRGCDSLPQLPPPPPQNGIGENAVSALRPSSPEQPRPALKRQLRNPLKLATAPVHPSAASPSVTAGTDGGGLPVLDTAPDHPSTTGPCLVAGADGGRPPQLVTAPSSPPDDRLSSYRKMYIEMRDEIKALDDRDPMSDPDLAYYLAGKGQW